MTPAALTMVMGLHPVSFPVGRYCVYVRTVFFGGYGGGYCGYLYRGTPQGYHFDDPWVSWCSLGSACRVHTFRVGDEGYWVGIIDTTERTTVWR
jgi:hypothetical protein